MILIDYLEIKKEKDKFCVFDGNHVNTCVLFHAMFFVPNSIIHFT